MTDAEFLREVKRCVQAIDPQAEVWLFGSRARGDFREDSDWDFLILTDKAFNRAFEWAIQDRLNELELKTDWVLNTFVYSKKDWFNRSMTDFHQNVLEDSKEI
jgi:predicted nucleotidyltransferase